MTPDTLVPFLRSAVRWTGVLAALSACGARSESDAANTREHAPDTPAAAASNETPQTAATVAPVPELTAADLRFSEIAAGRDRFCGLTIDSADLVCVQGDEITTHETGPFIDFSLHEDTSTFSELCTIREGGELRCQNAEVPPPEGMFSQVAVGFFNACAIQMGRVVCWYPPAIGGAQPFEAYGRNLSVDMYHGCVSTDLLGHMTCFGSGAIEAAEEHHFQTFAVAADRVCGMDRDANGTVGIVCVSNQAAELVLEGFYIGVDVNVDGDGCGVSNDGEIHCWGALSTVSLPGTNFFRQVSVSSSQVCGLDVEDKAQCWSK